MSKKTPLQRVTEQHGGKDKLVDKLVDLVDRGDEDKAEFRSRLRAAPNSKLLRLHGVSTEVKERFGSKDKLVDSLVGLMSRPKDKDYRNKLQGLNSVRLLSMHRTWEKKSKQAERRA